MKKYVEFMLEPRKPNRKTDVYSVNSKSDGGFLGEIKWYAPWRQYVFEIMDFTIWSKGCLKQITDFIQKLMDDRKKETD